MNNQTFVAELKAGIRTSFTWTGARFRKAKRILCQSSMLLVLLLIAGCNPTTTLFQSNFDPTPVDQPPATAQTVGTVAVDGGVRVNVIPGTNVKGAKFNRIGGANTALLRCNLAQTPGDGIYVFSTSLYFPSGSGGLATIAFENGAGQQFLHLDFPFVSSTTGHVRIDDDETTVFGETKRDQLFIVQVTLNISGAGATAKVVLSGAGVSGEATRNIPPPFVPFARQFGRVSISSGLQADDSTFYATNIVVTRRN
jgi:hypothetical protein